MNIEFTIANKEARNHVCTLGKHIYSHRDSDFREVPSNGFNSSLSATIQSIKNYVSLATFKKCVVVWFASTVFCNSCRRHQILICFVLKQ